MTPAQPWTGLWELATLPQSARVREERRGETVPPDSESVVLVSQI